MTTRPFLLLVVFLVAGYLICDVLEASSFDDRWTTVRKAEPKGLTLSLDLPKKTFYQGEVIPATLVFKNTSSNFYHMWIGTYDRSGRIPDIAFFGTEEHTRFPKDGGLAISRARRCATGSGAIPWKA